MNLSSEIAAAYQAFASGDDREAAARVSRILESTPNEPGALTLLGRIALRRGDAEIAHETFEALLQRYPSTAALWLDLALCLRDLAHFEEALSAARRSVALDANQPLAWLHLGEIALALDARDVAIDAFQRVCVLQPINTAALRGLCQAERPVPGSALVQRLEALLTAAQLSATQQADLHYALAQVYRKTDRTRFMAHLWSANAKQRSLYSRTRAHYERIFDREEAAFNAQAFKDAKAAARVEPCPIFILGMPRSGTTLTERLLASHPRVAPGGEMDYIRRPLRRALERHTNQPFPQGFERLDAISTNDLAQAFARRLRIVGGEASYVTDKTPGNYHLLGLLHILFPAGRIVHVARDPIDTCFSILQYRFDDRSPHTCDIELLAFVYARYARTMRRWQELMPAAYTTVSYEQLVQSPSEHGAELFSYCGLEWSEEYLQFHRAPAAVRTFSSTQVRQPIYTSSIGAWREYASELEPLRAALERELRQAGVPAYLY